MAAWKDTLLEEWKQARQPKCPFESESRNAGMLQARPPYSPFKSGASNNRAGIKPCPLRLNGGVKMANATEITAEAFRDSLKHHIETQKLHALIKQLGEALWIANANMDKISYDVDEALEAYNNYLRERGE